MHDVDSRKGSSNTVEPAFCWGVVFDHPVGGTG